MEDQVLQGDCLEVLPTFSKPAFNLVFVDPPYNIGIDYGHGKQADRLQPVEYLGRMTRLIAECHRLLVPTGSLWFLVPERWADEIGRILTQHLPRRNRIIWRETFGQYREDRFPPGHRHLFWHVKDSTATPFYADEIRVPSRRMEAGDKRAAGPRVPDDVWEIPRLVGNSVERIETHPCQLPEALLERVIRCSTQCGDSILDPMAGTGTTLRVAQRLGRRFVGIEQQETFTKLIEQRLAQPIQQQLF